MVLTGPAECSVTGLEKPYRRIQGRRPPRQSVLWRTSKTLTRRELRSCATGEVTRNVTSQGGGMSVGVGGGGAGA